MPIDQTTVRHIATRASAEFRAAVLAPLLAYRRAYLPPIMVYFAYGALGLIAIADSFWVKGALKLSPADLAGLSVWLTLPWAIKMVFGELVDTVPLLRSQRRSYIFVGAGLIALSLLMLAGAAGGWLTFAKPDTLYITAKILSVIGVVLQDVVADAMTTEVVPRENADGAPREKSEIDRDLAMVQILGRIALSFGGFAVAGLGGWLASRYSAQTVFLLALVIPVISIVGALMVEEKDIERSPTDQPMLFGGIAFGGFVAALGLFNVPHAQEITFVVSMAVIGTMLWRLTQTMDIEARRRIFYAALIIFVFRATPGIGDGYRWFAIDKLGFDEAFYGVLDQIGTTLALVVLWLFAALVSRYKITTVLLWIIFASAVLAIPTLVLVNEGHHWTERILGLNARGIAIVDSAAANPIAGLSMIPLLTLIAINAPAKQRATWFALMSSFMNLALVAAEIGTKWLNTIFVVERGAYGQLPALTVWAMILSIILPLAAILAWRRRVD